MTGEAPLVDIIIASFNSTKFIEACLSSVLKNGGVGCAGISLGLNDEGLPAGKEGEGKPRRRL